MRIHALSLLLLFLTNLLMAQTKHKPLNELINTQEPRWEIVQNWIKNAKNSVEVLQRDSLRADSALYQTQVTTKSPMGAIVYETGGIFIDSGWIRILGSGSERLNRSLMEWNKGKSFNNFGEQPSFLLVADDILGGFYAINAGGLDKSEVGKLFYFSPDNLSWEKTGLNYSEFLHFCFNGDLDLFYKRYRWENWIKDVSILDGNKGMSIYPFLWTTEGRHDINKNSKKPVPIQELWDFYFLNAREQNKF